MKLSDCVNGLSYSEKAELREILNAELNFSAEDEEGFAAYKELNRGSGKTETELRQEYAKYADLAPSGNPPAPAKAPPTFTRERNITAESSAVAMLFELQDRGIIGKEPDTHSEWMDRIREDHDTTKAVFLSMLGIKADGNAQVAADDDEGAFIVFRNFNPELSEKEARAEFAEYSKGVI